MINNVGGFDRLFRLIVGPILLAIAIFGVSSAGWAVFLAIVGIVLFVTGLTRICPAYLPFKASTFKKKEDSA